MTSLITAIFALNSVAALPVTTKPAPVEHQTIQIVVTLKLYDGDWRVAGWKLLPPGKEIKPVAASRPADVKPDVKPDKKSSAKADPGPEKPPFEGQCTAATKSTGRRCRNKAGGDMLFCHYHQPQ